MTSGRGPAWGFFENTLVKLQLALRNQDAAIPGKEFADFELALTGNFS